MKKTIIAIMLGLIAVAQTSCTDIYESAYQSELDYKAKKENPEMFGSLEMYEQEFMQKYESMDATERLRYKAYRRRMKEEAEREYNAMKRTEEEAYELLNN